MLIFLIQWGGARFHPGPVSMVGPVILVLASAAIGLVTLPILSWVVPRTRRRLKIWRRVRRRRLAAAGAEIRARAMMGELCPGGWQARITLYNVGADEILSGEAEPGRPRGPVALDWSELRAGVEPTVVRRVWAPSVVEALDAMVADRRTDETLEQIEQAARADGALWPDLEHGADV